MSPRQQEALDEVEVQHALERILERNAAREETLLGRLWEWFKELFPNGEASLSTAAGWWAELQGVLLLLCLVGLLVWGLRFLQRQFGRHRAAGDQAGANQVPVQERVALLRQAALEARRAGDWKLSLQKQFFALVLGLGERGDLEFREAWTNRELLALGSPSREVQALLGPLLEELEPKEFGRLEVQAEDLDRLEQLASSYFGELRMEAR